MNGIFKRALSILLAAMMCILLLPASAWAESGGGVDEADVTLDTEENILCSGYCGAGDNQNNVTWELTKDYCLTVSGSWNMADYSLISMAPWYEYRDEIKSVSISNGLTSIGNFAFYNCTSLESIDIPDSVIRIGDSAFSGCSSLESIVLPKFLTVIQDGTFSNCSSLKSIVLPKALTVIQDGTFSNCSSLESIDIPEGVVSIDALAFSGCTALSEIVFNETVQPNMVFSAFLNVKASAYYPCSWTAPTQSYGGTLNWIPYHRLVYKVEYKAPTPDVYGNIEHWKCLGCWKLFTDEACSTELSEEDVKIAKIVCGDIDMNGTIDVTDVYALRKAVSGLAELSADQKKVADIYGDDRYNSLDVNLLRRHIAGIVTEIPYYQG